MLISILVIFIAGLFIYYSGNKFARISSEIGDYFNLSHSVKGATLDAIAGSFPELMIVTFAVVFFGKFDVGVGTVAGSVLFNILVIPSIAVLFSPVVFRVSREVIARDAVFYVIAILSFLSAVLYSPLWGFATAIIFIGIYFWYINLIIKQTQRKQLKDNKTLGGKISVVEKIISGLFYIIIMGVAVYFLAEHAIILSNLLNIPVIVIAFSVVALATSIPDMIIAVANAKKGRTDDVMSNVFGSNIFDILIALGVPLLLATILIGKDINIVSGGIDLIIGLVVATIVVLYFIIDDYVLTKKNAFIMLTMYVLFISYLFLRSFLGIF